MNLTHKQRAILALEGKQPDYVPIISTAWHVFGPVPRTQPPLSVEQRAKMPTKLMIEGKELLPQLISVEHDTLDMSPYIGGTAGGNIGYVYIPFEVEQDGIILFGLGADYWFESWLDGQPLMDDLETGSKFPPPPTPLDYIKRVNLAKGRHLLLIRFISGTGSSLLCASVQIRPSLINLFSTATDESAVQGRCGIHSAVLSGERPVPPIKNGGLEELEGMCGHKLYFWKDVCNVYVLQSGDTALLVDLGDGSVLEHLAEIGVRKLEGVLFTHHHREQCQGAHKLQAWNPQLAAPAKERALFETPGVFITRNCYDNNSYSVSRLGAIYARPPIDPLVIQHGLIDGDTFVWRGHEFLCMETPGNSPGGMSYLLRSEDGWIAFTGDVIMSGGKMHNWFDSDWSYGGGEGLNALLSSVTRLQQTQPSLMRLMPSHGAVIAHPLEELQAYGSKLNHLKQLRSSSHGGPDKLSKPTAIPNVSQTSKHLFKLNSGENFTLLLADSGRALMIDCGNTRSLESTLDQMVKHFGLKAIDAILITHMHSDHIMDAPKIREQWGAEIWTLNRIADKFEQPRRFNYLCPVADPIRIDRVFRSGEKFSWEGYELTVDWMPGQTEFGCCVHGRIDDRLVAFTGDNIFPSNQPGASGHPASNARCSMIFEEGYIYGADYLRRLQPDLIMCGHSHVIDQPEELIERYYQRSVEMRDAFKNLSSEKDYRYMFDPFWVRADPYRVMAHPGDKAKVTVHVRNFLNRERTYRLDVHCPEGIQAESASLLGTVPAGAVVSGSLQLKISDKMKRGAWLVALDTTMDEQRYGEWFEFVVVVD